MLSFIAAKLGGAGKTLIMSLRVSFELVIFNAVVEFIKQPFSCCCKVAKLIRRAAFASICKLFPHSKCCSGHVQHDNRMLILVV